MNNKRIKIEYVNGTESNSMFGKMYEAVKQNGDVEDIWHRHGRVYSNIKRLFGFTRGNRDLEIIMANEIIRDLKEYETIMADRKEDYLREQKNSKRKL